MSGFSMDDYVDVAQRIQDFKTEFPNGSLRPADPQQPYRIEVVGDKTFIVYAAAAYRDRDDTAPGIGLAWEPFPGKSNYTRDSELQNAETSAWGRAIVAVLASTSKKIASAQEVRNRSEDRAPTAARPSAPVVDPVAKALDDLMGIVKSKGLNPPDVGATFIDWNERHVPLAESDEATVREFTAKVRTGELVPA